MKGISVLCATALFCTLAVSALAREQRADSNGYELYSWKVKGTWHYSLVQKTSHELTREEIVSKSNIKVGDAALRHELKKLPRGEKVSWMSDGPRGEATPAGKHTTTFKHPSRGRIARLKSYGDKIGIHITLR